jgi:hypothetical protein
VREQGPSKRLKRGSDRRFLELNHGTWRVVVGRRVNGKVVRLQRSLGTSSLRDAQRLRWPIVAELKTVLHKGGQLRPIDDPETWRAALAARDGGPDDPTPYALSDHLDALRDDPIATEQGDEGPSTSMTLSGNAAQLSSLTEPTAGQPRWIPIWTLS